MAQPSVACYFNNRKRSANEDIKINRVKKVLVLDSNDSISKQRDGLGISGHESETKNKDDVFFTEKIGELQEKEENIVALKRIVVNTSEKQKSVQRKILSAKPRTLKGTPNNKDIQELLNNMKQKKVSVQESIQKTVIDSIDDRINEIEQHVTPPSTPKKTVNALDKVKENAGGPSLKEIRKQMTRSSRLAELKASLNRFQEKDKQLKEIEKKTVQIESPMLKSFRTIELEVQTSPQKIFSPEKSYLSPKKDLSARRNLLPQLTPRKNLAATSFDSPSKQILEEVSRPALTLPFKYRHLAELFRSVDIVCQILFNRKEVITFRKLKPAVEEMMKRNLLERHLAQIKSIYPDAFDFSIEKLKVFGTGMKQEQWELVVSPKIESDHINSDVLLQRRRKLFGILLDRVKMYHAEFLATLDPPITISKADIKRWHPEFDIERVPDIEAVELPQPPIEDKFTSGQDVLEKARQMFNCNTRMEQALLKLHEAKSKGEALVVEEVKTAPTSVLKGIPKALLEKVRQKQAAKALLSMTRSADKEKEVQMYSRLPEIARLTRNIFVSEKKGVLPLDVVMQKLENCYRENLSKSEMEEHLRLITKEAPNLLIFHNIRNCNYIKLNKSTDLSTVLTHLEKLVKEKSDS